MANADPNLPPALDALSATDVLRRVAGTVAIHLYEMEVFPDGDYICHAFIGAGLESLLGRIPADLTSEEAWERAIAPEDRDQYEAAYERVRAGEPVEVEYRLVGYDGRTRWVWDRMHPARTDDGRLLVEGMVIDVSERKKTEQELAAAQRQLAHIAYHDPLTDLPNRLMLEEHLERALARCERERGALALLFIDLDNFKLINDSFGHAAGDELLRAVAERLRESTRAGDMVARQGGDEFLVLADSLDTRTAGGRDGLEVKDAAASVAAKLGRVLQAPFAIPGLEIYVSASVGISIFPNDAEDAQTLLKHADVAMYKAKQSGRNGYELYRPDGKDALIELSMAGRLRQAVEQRRDLVLHYQPLVRLADQQIVGVEALIRWRDGDGLVPPASFLPLAERIGLIGRISEWVLEEACSQATEWQQAGLELDVSVNLPPSFWQPTAMRHVLSTIEAFGLRSERLMVEITESALMVEDRPAMESALAELHRRGLRLAIDDFGTGHSSLSRLHRMRVSTLKIDRSFVQELPDDPNAKVLVASIIGLSRSLGLEPLAEGIETPEQCAFLLERGCWFGQGFYFSPAVPPEEIPVLVARSRPGTPVAELPTRATQTSGPRAEAEAVNGDGGEHSPAVRAATERRA
jgi:diguanylate cyclase (GGDEF)-like protein/PAS domain S-box-containing protein